MNRLVPLLFLLAACAPKVPVEPATQPGADPSVPAPSAPAPAGAPAPAPPSGTALHDRVNEAAALIESGSAADLERAIQILESAAAEDGSGQARLNLGLAYQKRGDLARASNQFQAVVAVHPEIGDAWLGLGNIQDLQGSSNAAFANYQNGLRNDPENVNLYVGMISALRRQGKTNEAIELAKSALKINAKSLPIYNNFGLCYLDQGNTVLAKFIFQKAIQEIDGAEQNALLQTNLGWTFYIEDNVPQATFHLQKAVELEPGLVPALVYLSRVYMDDHNYGDTVPLLESAAKIDANNPDVQLTLGVAYRGVGRLEDAKRAYEKALALDPSDPAPHFNLGVLFGDYNKNYDGAVASFSNYIAAGGKEAALAEQYIKDIKKEKENAEKRANAEEERKKKDEERKRKEQVLKDAENAPAPAPEPAPPAPAPDAPAPAPAAPAPAAPAPAPAPAPDAPPPGDSPWGSEPGGQNP